MEKNEEILVGLTTDEVFQPRSSLNLINLWPVYVVFIVKKKQQFP